MDEDLGEIQELLNQHPEFREALRKYHDLCISEGYCEATRDERVCCITDLLGEVS